ncbi:MAG: flagellar hook-length control protein FliK [Defluviitaleaceae bacterium]|nr:flagellar hook-length control protein FliK [Defluviitaleaceae bacterium]
MKIANLSLEIPSVEIRQRGQTESSTNDTFIDSNRQTADRNLRDDNSNSFESTLNDVQSTNSSNETNNRESSRVESENRPNQISNENIEENYDLALTAYAGLYNTTLPITDYVSLDVPVDNYNVDILLEDFTVVFEAVATVLDITPEEVNEILENLNIDPIDLQDVKKQTEVLMTHFDVESPVELLNVENIADIVTSLNKEITQVIGDVVYTDESISSPIINLNIQNEEIDIDVSEEIVPRETWEANEINTVNTSENTQDFNQDSSFGENTENTENDFLENENTQKNTQNINNQNTTDENSQALNVNLNNYSAEIITPEKINVQNTQIPFSGRDVIEQIKGQFKLSLSGAVSEMKIIITPETLGEVSLRILTQNGIIKAMFETENQRVKEAIEANFNELKEEMSSKGIEVGELSVSVKQENKSLDNFLREQEKSRQRISNIIKNIESETIQVDSTPEIQISGSTVSYTV